MDRWVKDLLERQAAWQKSRASLSWEEKLRQSLIMREVHRSFREVKAGGAPVAETGRSGRQGPPD
jgi:hypothetical protein